VALVGKYTSGLRRDAGGEASGIGEAEHAESAYDCATVGRGSVLGRHGGEE